MSPTTPDLAWSTLPQYPPPWMRIGLGRRRRADLRGGISNDAIAPDSGRSRDPDRTTEVDPKRAFRSSWPAAPFQVELACGPFIDPSETWPLQVGLGPDSVFRLESGTQSA